MDGAMVTGLHYHAILQRSVAREARRHHAAPGPHRIQLCRSPVDQDPETEGQLAVIAAGQAGPDHTVGICMMSVCRKRNAAQRSRPW